jgi:LuxR family transcriptional regulator, maltose regulon positive regulatory protein
MTNVMAVEAEESGGLGLLDRKSLLQLLDRAVTKPLTVLSAPPGSGKTSLLRAWSNHSETPRRVVFVSVERDEHSDQGFWSAVLGALAGSARSAAPAPGVDQLIAGVRSEITDHPEPVVLIVDDLHELRSPGALEQLERFVAELPGNASVVLSSRRDPSIRLHRLRLAGAVTEIRGADLRFSESETRRTHLRSTLNHRIPASPAHPVGQHDPTMASSSQWYLIRIRGHLGPTALFAFPTMTAELSGGETVLTGALEDQAAVYGVLAQIEALGLDLLELRRTRKSPGSGEEASLD